MALVSFSPDTIIKSADLNSNFSGLADGTLIDNDYILGLVYPIGSYYINESDSTNPATLMGFGVWVAVTDHVLVGKGSGTFATAGATGGAETHTLTTAEMPVHKHTLTDPGHYHASQADYASVTKRRTTAYETGSSSFRGVVGNATARTGSKSTGITMANTGSGSAHNIMNPYIVVYMWKRTA